MPVPNEPKGPKRPKPKTGSTGVKRAITARAGNLGEAVGSRTAKSRGVLAPGVGNADRATRKKIDEMKRKPSPALLLTLISNGVTPEQFRKMYPKSAGADIAKAYERIYNESEKTNADYANPVLQQVKDAVSLLNPSNYIYDKETPDNPKGYPPYDGGYMFESRSAGKGSPNVIDRSEAMKKAWATRKKLYGPSGFKDK